MKKILDKNLFVCYNDSMKWNDYRIKSIKYVTNSSFADLSCPGTKLDDSYKPTWTVADEDHDGLYSFKKWFLKFKEDPTEIKFVDACFEGDYRHWEAFKSSQYIRPIYERVKKEAEKRLLADVMQKLYSAAMDDNNKSQMVALKFLVDRGQKLSDDEPKGRGRPKKADIDKAAREIAEEDKALAEDLKRIS